MKEMKEDHQKKDSGSPGANLIRKIESNRIVAILLIAFSVYFIFEFGRRVGEVAFHLSN